MAYAKIEAKVVVFKTYETDTTLTEIPDDVCCGMIQNKDGTFSNPPKSNDQLFNEIRFKRDQLLTRTDVYALSDRNITDAMKKYRQDLRDLPASNADPNKIVFPTKPS